MAKIRLVPSVPAVTLDADKRYLIVADLHIGFEKLLSRGELSVGNTVLDMVADLQRIISMTKSDTLVLLGDVKSGTSFISKTEWTDVPLFFEKMSQTSIILVPGNHDARIQQLTPDNIQLASSAGLIIDDILLTHGHALPPESFSHVNHIIIGHVHPVFCQDDSVLNGQRVWVSIRADKSTVFPSRSGSLEITIVPSFNKYLHSHKSHNRRSISPIIQRVRTQISSARIVTLDGSIIGDKDLINYI